MDSSALVQCTCMCDYLSMST
uniref:Uncharacterized protein n=1 Tax=Anguilla anguilla TaxID=7936 RepID=A0A0E9U9E6_ANGAN